MDRRSWLWRRKSSEKSPGETESSGSVSSHSERYSDDQEAAKGSSNNVSPNHAQSPEVSSNIGDGEVHESVKSLTEKLSAALLDISAKEELVRQHAKVAEEAVSGWEQAETEVAALKQQLEAANQKNSALEYRLGHLDDALKECVRQLRQAREQQEEKVHDVVVKKTHEWESEKLELEKQLVKLKAQMQAEKSEAAAAVSLGLQAKLEAAEKENATLKVELLSQSEDLQMLTLERELSNKAAETASKQHLESIKKVAKLEAECRRLRSQAYKALPVNGHKPIANSFCMESVTDSQSDSGERLLCMDNEPGCSDSWASALIAELDQFKNVKASASKLTTSVEIDLMDDFLEMERLVGLPEADRVSSSFELADSDQVTVRDSPLKVKALHMQLAELDEKVKKIESEKAELEMALVDSQNQLKASCNQLRVAEDKLLELQRQLDLANESKQAAVAEVEDLEAKRKLLESQLESAELEVGKLYDKVRLLEGKIEDEEALSAELKARLESAEGARKVSDSQLESASLEVGSLHEMVVLLESKVEEERASSTEFAAEVQALEAVRKALGTQLDSAHLEINKLHDKVDSLQVKAEEERTKSAEFTTKVESVEAARKALEFELETKHLEIGKLHDKVGLLEVQVNKEKALSAEFAAKCQKLESEILRIKRDAELWQVTSSNVDLKIKKEKELAVAAGKLAECQKTIASLGQQLKSLTALDELVHETGKLEFSGGSPDPILHSSNSSENITSYTLPNGKERGSPPSCSLSPSSSTLSGFTVFLSRSRSSSHIEN